MTASSAGGKAVFKKYGKAHMVTLGKRGARAFYDKYVWRPVPVGKWAIVRKSDNVIIKVIGERPF